MVYLLLFFVSFLSGIIIFYYQEKIKPFISGLLSFSGAYLLGVCFLHLLPELFEFDGAEAGLYLLVGFFLQLILDYFSGGIEHGHTHVNYQRIGKFPVLILISLSLHAFLEALPIQRIEDDVVVPAYLIGLLIHKAPISFILASLLLAYQLNKKWILFGIIAFSLSAPLGVFVGSNVELSIGAFQNLIALSVGIILHLSTTLLIENNEEHTIQWRKLLPLLAGVSLALLTLLFH